MDLLHRLEGFFRTLRNAADLASGDGVVVAFSGGPDSTALLWGMSRLAPCLSIRLFAAHLDHALDPGSAARAAAAADLAAQLGVPLIAGRCDVRAGRLAGESDEAAARRERYAFLDETRRRLGARWVATAHHQDDQAETVLLRLLFGSGLEGLAGIRPAHGTVLRPLLGAPRAELAAAVAAAGLAPVDDPTNRDLGVPRNRVRHRLLPALHRHDRTDPTDRTDRSDPDLAPRLARLAGRARAAGAALDRRLAGLLLAPAEGEVAIDRAALERLPTELWSFALAWLHRRAGAPYPAGTAARAELLRQLAGGGSRGRPACDCGGGWRWEARGGLLTLRRAQEAREPVPDFTYTLEVPGELEVPEVSVRMRLFRRAVEPWMFQGSPQRAGLALPLTEGDRVTIRNRRPGDRIHPLGAAGSRRLKEVLIDRRVPRPVRERLPLLCVGEGIAWVPGIAIEQRFRLAGHATAWVAEVATT
ncbi:MAG TPA: tRNA lysidine(34) synthetase TilS [Thermoanaerobaculia bacterium]|jgi:tRNA(Ile)-lysidine synthase|nr:tRNA lysidine(34) synthetase TilS [Thermoanaerobaculia bacterium]